MAFYNKDEHVSQSERALCLVKNILEGAADLFLGSACPGCGLPGLGICHECLANAFAQPVINRNLLGDLSVSAACEYKEPVNRLILVHKNRSGFWLKKPLARLIAEKLEIDKSAILCPIPSDPAAVRRRGYDHTYSLAKEISSITGCKALRLLERCRAAGDQIGRNKISRSSAQKNTMRARSGFNMPVLLFDDVVTTGATLREAKRALGDAKISCEQAVTIASTGLRLPNFP